MIGTPLTLPIESTTPRRFAVSAVTGTVFADGDHFDGYTLTIEITCAEAIACAQHLLQRHPEIVAPGSFIIDPDILDLAQTTLKAGAAS